MPLPTPKTKAIASARIRVRKPRAPRKELRDRSADKSIVHGTAGGYTNHQCSCERCLSAFTATMGISRARRTSRGLPADDHRHGSQNGYGNWGCRCARCTEAHREYKNRTKAS